MKAKLATDAELKRVVNLYTDGGVIGQNPSPYGGTWAYVLVDAAGAIVEQNSGLLAPMAFGLPTISNNVTELYAMCMALQRLPDGWKGTVFCDSQITLRRCFQGARGWNGVHDDLKAFTLHCVERLAPKYQIKTVLLAGHPSRADLERGYRIKKNNPEKKWPVSKFNVLCDDLCGQQAKMWRKGQAIGCTEVSL